MKDYSDAIMHFLQTFDHLKDKNDDEKELYVHDYCIKNFSYDYSFGEHAHSVLGPILHGTSVCEGISKLVKLVFDYLGVKSLLVIGSARNPINNKMEGHMWNIIKLDGKTYHLDVTFDLCLSGSSIRYDYYNLCDHQVKKDHIITSDVPGCLTSGNDYYTLNSQVIRGSRELSGYIAEKLRHGQKNIAFRAINKKNIVNIVIEIANEQCRRSFRGGYSIQYSHNPEQSIFELNIIGGFS